VFVGGDNLDPFIIKDLEDVNTILALKSAKPIYSVSLEEAYQLLPYDVKSKIIMVPDEHKQSFQGDIIIALQDIAGYSVSAANKLFNSNSAYQKCLNNTIHPFSREEIILSTTNEALQDGFLPIKSYLYNGLIFDKLNMKRYMHLDLALTGDSLGISMCHISGWKSIYKQDSNYNETDYNNGLVDDEIKIPVITYDFMLKVNPPKKPNKISLSKVRDFIVYLKNELGIKFDIITADQFQSAQLLQELDELGFNTGYLSVDRTPDAYLAFTNLIYEERVKFYNYEPFKKELFNVVYYPAKKKVDHTSIGSKDVADSVVGAAFNAIKSLDKTDTTEQSLVDIFVNLNENSDSAYGNAVEDALNNLLDMLKQGKS
jgi:predicted nucleotidyltransferase